jgi:type II secretory pathway component PulF
MDQIITNISDFLYEYFFFITVGALFLVFAFLFTFLGEQEPPTRKHQVRKAE